MNFDYKKKESPCSACKLYFEPTNVRSDVLFNFYTHTAMRARTYAVRALPFTLGSMSPLSFVHNNNPAAVCKYPRFLVSLQNE